MIGEVKQLKTMENKAKQILWYDRPLKKVTDKVLHERFHSLKPELKEQDSREQMNILNELGERYLKGLDAKFKGKKDKSGK